MVELSKKYHRTSFTPGQDLQVSQPMYKQSAPQHGRDEVIEAYEAQQAANQISQPQ
jgi:hypothetical protein